MAPSPPHGTITLLFTDIEGSTTLLRQLGDDYATVLADQRELLRAVFAKWNGHEADTQGDSFFVAFASAGDAVAAAAEAQQGLAAHRWPAESTVRVRMGLHTGEPRVRSTGYVGMDVHRAARIAAAAHGGQVLLSQTTRDLVGEHLPAGYGVLDLGDHSFKDFQSPQRIFQLIGPGLRPTFPPLPSLAAPPHNLPAQPTTLLGRDDLLAAVHGLLAQSDVRLLTLVGLGGVGKTRLGLQLAAIASDTFPDGVYFVALAPVRHPELVMSTIAHAIGVSERGRVPIADLLIQRLQRKRTLLLLDNFEHLVEAAPSISQVLTRCPHVTMLVTSREPLRIQAERQFPIPCLPLPELTGTSATLASNPAVALFVERARAVRPGFALSDGSARSVAEICVYLTGLPLAIELAAARAKVLSPEAILQRLQASALRWLTEGPRDAPDRQRTLQASIEWSYELLSREEQTAFRRLGIFVGGFSLFAAEALGVTTEAVASLLDKSLIQRHDTAGGDEPRFAMLELVRQYARERLNATDERATIEEQHTEFYLNLALEAEPHLEAEAANQGFWLDRLEVDEANLRAAMRSTLEARAVEPALRLGYALSHYWFLRGYVSEGRAALDRILALPGVDERADLLSKVLDRAGILAGLQADFEHALELTERCLAIRRRLGDREGIAETLANLAYVLIHRDDLDRAADASRESLTIQSEIGSNQARADALNNLALIAYYRGEVQAAQPLAVESVQIWEQQGYQQGSAWALHILGNIEVSLGHHDRGRRCYERSLTLAIELGFLWGIAFSLEGLARLAVEEQQPTRAFILAGAAEHRRRTVGIPLPGAGRAEMDGVLARARQTLPEPAVAAALAHGQRLGDQELLAWLRAERVLPPIE